MSLTDVAKISYLVQLYIIYNTEAHDSMCVCQMCVCHMQLLISLQMYAYRQIIRSTATNMYPPVG